jgi:hypothetical protein
MSIIYFLFIEPTFNSPQISPPDNMKYLTSIPLRERYIKLHESPQKLFVSLSLTNFLN